MPTHAQRANLLNLSLPHKPQPLVWGQTDGSAISLAIAEAIDQQEAYNVIVVPDNTSADRMLAELRFFVADPSASILALPDWETLPYDVFSPLEDIVSARLATLHRLATSPHGALVLPIITLMHRLAPPEYLHAHSLVLAQGDPLDFDGLRHRLEAAGYVHVSQVMAHGEFTLRGGIIDLFPNGSPQPYRIDLLDDEVDSIRVFDPETQRSIEQVERVQLLPAHEFPLTADGIKGFRNRFRSTFEGDPQASPIYREVSAGRAPAGIEYYLPLFFDGMATLFDYLPEKMRFFLVADVAAAARAFHDDIDERYEQRRHDREHPLLAPEQLFLSPAEVNNPLARYARVYLQADPVDKSGRGPNAPVATLPDLRLQPRNPQPAAALAEFLDTPGQRILFLAESPGRRERLRDELAHVGIRTQEIAGWQDFLGHTATPCLGIGPVERGLLLPEHGIAIVTEKELHGERAQQRRRRHKPTIDESALISNLNDLSEGSPVVHEEHGVGRFLGLQTMIIGSTEAEFLTLEYAGGDKLYVPVSSLHLISRYTGNSPETAPLHRLGSDQWQKARRKAAEKAHDVAAELLDIYARRAAEPGQGFAIDATDYAAFADAFPFEETPDQEKAIAAVLADMASPHPMDRVVCGDVGFGKTEVAMRAAFIAANAGAQVAVLVPTTLLAQQHTQNFQDRFADWPIRIASLSRFGGQKTQVKTLQAIADGQIDIVIGTHKLLQADVKFKQLGLVIIDEEHRFGVRHKERLKSLRAQVDTLTLTATPIPRTLNMSLAGLRELSIIATPPAERHAIKTFVGEWNDALIREACLRELNRGGQVYFLHNEVQTIDNMASRIADLIPDTRIQVAHGQIPERDLERVMFDFYHRRFSILVCTTIIESGIDVPSANTIVIHRADKLGLAQLHQLRGRVGRSHHRAYAYLITPPKHTMTPDAVKRLDAIASLEDLGVGFTLASHDLEIRGAGELLGEEQTGQIQEIGFTLYNELLERAVNALKSGHKLALEQPLHSATEIDLGYPTLIPEDYVPDVHHRLILYKRIASAPDEDALRDLQVELIDRFGLLPPPTKRLFEATRLKLLAQQLSLRKIEVGQQTGRLIFDHEPKIDTRKLIQLIQKQPQTYRLEGQAKLVFRQSMADFDQRVAVVERLIGSIAIN